MFAGRESGLEKPETMPSKVLVGLALGVARNIDGCLQINKNLGANLKHQTLNISIAINDVYN